MFQRIVVGIDRGELADHAIEVALELGETLRAALEFVHGADLVAPVREIGPEPWSEIATDALDDVRAACTAHLARLATTPRRAEFLAHDHLHVLPLPSAQALLTRARDTAADLLLIGAHRHRKLIDFGGTGRAVLARSSCPVWVQPAPPRDLRTILAPVDLSPSSELVFRAARFLGETFGARVEVLNCFRPPVFAYDADAVEPPGLSGAGGVIADTRRGEQEELDSLVSAFDWRGVSVGTMHAEGDAWKEILARQDDCDLIVMGTHGRTGLARAVLGSVAYRVLKGTRRAILVVPLPAASYGER